jgi:hypothetical protein
VGTSGHAAAGRPASFVSRRRAAQRRPQMSTVEPIGPVTTTTKPIGVAG